MGRIYLLYIILIILVISIGYAYITAKERIEHADNLQSDRKLSAMMKKFETEGIVNYPSWMHDENLVENFERVIITDSIKAQIPMPFILAILEHKEYRDETFRMAALMEDSDYTFEEQAAAASDIIVQDWYKMPESKRRAIINKK